MYYIKWLEYPYCPHNLNMDATSTDFFPCSAPFPNFIKAMLIYSVYESERESERKEN